MEAFLNSKTMITPAIAGGITTLITGVVTTQFQLPGKWVGLLISFLLGLVVFFVDTQTPRPAVRAIFLVLNTLIIFSVAVGANATGAAVVNPEEKRFETQEVNPEGKRFFHDWFDS